MYANPEELFGGTQRLLALIDLIYSAVNDAACWPVVLEQVSEALAGRETVMFTSFADPTATNVTSMARIDPVALLPYVEHYASVNVLSKRCDDLYVDGTARYAHRAVPDAEFERTEFCNDYFHPHGMHYSIGIKVPLAGQAPAYLACMRKKREGGFGDAEGTALEILMPHLQRALMLHLQMGRMEAKAEGMGEALDVFGHAVFGVNGEGRVMAANRAAEEIVRKGDGLRIMAGRLEAEDAGEDSHLQAMLGWRDGGVGAAARMSARRSMRLSRRLSPPLSVVLVPLPSGQLTDLGRMEALVVASDPGGRMGSRAEVLRELYRLTPTEARMADLIAQGNEVREAALVMRTTLETARFHMKRVLTKTGARRQAELVRLVVSLPGC